jgi:hypothetical protein
MSITWEASRETGFNSETEGIYDIFASLGADPTLKGALRNRTLVRQQS